VVPGAFFAEVGTSSVQRKASSDRGFLFGLRGRLVFMAVVLSCGFSVIGWRLYQIQIVDHVRFAKSAENMHTYEEKVHGYRGSILTRDGVILARDVIDYEIALDPTKIEDKSLGRVIQTACELLQTSSEFRRESLRRAVDFKSRNRQWLSMARNVEELTAAKIRTELRAFLTAKEMRGYIVQPQPRREYPRGQFAASIVGVTNRERNGVEGVEHAMNAYLTSQSGYFQVHVSGAQKNKMRSYNPGSAYVAPVAGYDVYCTIDSRVQALVEQKLEWGIKRMRAEAGVCIVLDCKRGDILALANYPTYAPERFHEYPKKERLMRRKNRVVESLYEPGSVVKAFIMSGVLEHQLASPHQSIRSLLPAGVTWDGSERAKFGSRTVRDVRENPTMTVEQALYRSSNIGMSVLGLRLGKDRLLGLFEDFGFASRTGIELPFEHAGRIGPKNPRRRWKPFLATVSISYGYAVTMTPLQIARAFAAIANGGYLLRPRIIDRIVREGTISRFSEREVVARPISEGTALKVRNILRNVVEAEDGTAKFLKIEGFPFGGKTGTARRVQNGRYTTSYLSSFEAFAPFDDPEVVVLCMMERPRENIYGSMAAGPVVVEVLRGMFNVEKNCWLASTAAW